MITLFTGAPGAGKTASMVDFLRTLPRDRPVFVDGLNGLDATAIPHEVIDATKWHDELPDGAILVIDEAQRVFRPRAAGVKVPPYVAALETHRHRGIDVLLTTQNPRLIDSNVRALVGRHVHIRDTGVLGRYQYEWPECSDDLAWKSCVNKRKISLPKKAFALYKSASLHVKPVRKIPLILWVLIAALIALAVLAYKTYGVIDRVQQAGESGQPLPVIAGGSLPLHSAPQDGAPGAIDDRIDWIPRISSMPETAPAYDHLRSVSVMPRVAASICSGHGDRRKCKCYTQQGTDTGLTSGECADWHDHPRFDPYLQAQNQQPVTGDNPGQPPQSSAETAQPEPQAPTFNLPVGKGLGV